MMFGLSFYLNSAILILRYLPDHLPKKNNQGPPMKVVAAALLLVLVTGCASITGNKLQPITVQTISGAKEIAGAGCTLINDAGKWFVTSPGSTTIQKSTGDLAVDCSKDGATGHESVVSKSNGAVWGNILLGGGIGYVVDRNTGAGFDYPSTITVTLIGELISPVGESVGLKPVAGTSTKVELPADPPKTEVVKADIKADNPQETMPEKLRELQKMHKDGLITDSEFNKKKQEYLSRM